MLGLWIFQPVPKIYNSTVWVYAVILCFLIGNYSLVAQNVVNGCFERMSCIDSLVPNPRHAEKTFSEALKGMNCESNAYPNLVLGLGKVYVSNGVYTSADSAISLLEECVQLTPLQKAEKLSLKVSLDIKRGNFDRAEVFSRQDLHYSWLVRDTSRFLRALHNHALLKYNQNQLTDAAKAFTAVNYLTEKYGFIQLHAQSLGNFSSLQSVVGNYERAEALLDKQRKLLATPLNDSLGFAMNYGNRAVMRMYRGVFDSTTLLLFDSALHYLDRNDDAYVAWIYNCQGYVYNRNYELESALNLHQKALEAANRANIAEERIRILTNLASDYYRLGQLDRAIAFQDSSLHYGKKLNNPQLLKGVYETQITIYREAGKLSEALETMEAYLSFRDSLNRLQVEAQIHEIEVKFQNEQLRRENLEQRIELDNERIQKLVLKNAMLFLALIVVGVCISSGIIIRQFQKRRQALRDRIRVLDQELRQLQRNEEISFERINKALTKHLGPITYLEYQVIELILLTDGEITIKEIADQLNVTTEAIKSRKKSIAKKLNIQEGSKYLISKKVLEICSDRSLTE